MKNRMLIVFSGMLIFFVVAYLGYDLIKRRISPCDSIFEQTTTQLDTKLKLANAEAELSIGKEKIQDLTEEAQKMALNLKACCVVSGAGKINPNQFLKCKESERMYEAQIDIIKIQLQEVKMAKMEGSSDVIEEKQRQIDAAVDKARSISRAFGEQVKKIERKIAEANPGPKGTEYFSDDFNGRDLANHWELINPAPDALIVENGELLVLNSTPAELPKENVPNLIRLTKLMPKGNWVTTARVRVDFQTGQERIFFGLYEDPRNYLLNVLSTGTGSCYSGGSYRYHLYGTPIKVLKGEPTSSTMEVWSILRCKGGTLSEKMSDGGTILLRMEKNGRAYISSVKMEGTEAPQWVKLNKLSLLQPKGRLAFGLYQNQQASGETSLTVEWIKIETIQ